MLGTRVMDAETARLAASRLASRALKAGDSAPDFVLPDAQGNPVRLYPLLREGHVVVVFYRGGWGRTATSICGAFSADWRKSVNWARRSWRSLHSCRTIRFLRRKRTSLLSR